jgi:NAD(P)-dependent dehydrogenase (short-subunit alcohol dehydrogenase family)
MTWNPLNLPDQTGRTIVVTGSTAGIGYFAAEQLAGAGARLVLAARSPQRIEAAAASIRDRVPGAEVQGVLVDLASRDSVERAADELIALGHIDGLLLNGGAMSGWRTRNADGLPLTLATHVVANVGLVTRLLPTLVASGTSERPSRIVHASSGFVDRARRIRLDDPRRASRIGVVAYTQAKAFTEVLAFELDRHLRAHGLPVLSLVSRPGVGVDVKTPERAGVHESNTRSRPNPYTRRAQGKDAAAWSAVRALTDPAAQGGGLYAPANGIAGPPALIDPPAHTAHPDAGVAEQLWASVADLAGVESPLTVMASRS